MNPKYCILIPSYNHAPLLDNTLKRVEATGYPYAVINDCSTDNTKNILNQHKAKHSDFVILERDKNGGKGAAISIGASWAFKQEYTHVITIDADGQHDIENVHQLTNRSRINPSAIITGKPLFDESIPWERKFFRKITNCLVAIQCCSLTVIDALCGLRIYPLKECKELLTSSKTAKRMDFDIEILVHSAWKNIRIIECPTQVRYPSNGISHFRYFRDNIIIAKMHIKLIIGMLLRLPKFILQQASTTRTS